MDPQVKSLLTSALLWATGAAAAWGVSKGLIPASEQNEVVNALVTLVTVAGGVAVAWWKKRAVAPAKMIEEINKADNGVKVVAATAQAPAVNAPLKEPGK